MRWRALFSAAASFQDESPAGIRRQIADNSRQIRTDCANIFSNLDFHCANFYLERDHEPHCKQAAPTLSGGRHFVLIGQIRRSQMPQAGRNIIGQIKPLLFLAALLLPLSGCTKDEAWHETDISGAMPDLTFTMTRADDGKEVTAADYRGKVVMLYFGYTFCPDVCPATLADIAQILKGLGPKAADVSVLFVTVDPNRDTLPVLKDYADAFAPEVDALRGTPSELQALAKRYRVSYSVKPKTADHDYEVSHGSAVYIFDKTGKIRLLATSLSSDKPDNDGTAADLKRLIGE
jgi:protein SCO1/2